MTVGLALLLSAVVLYATPGESVPSFLARNWQASEGLPHNSPTRVRQAPDGYLWIATNSGVSRFDGVRFETFGVRDGLPDNQIQSLLVDSKSRVWAGTMRGVAVREAGRWRTLHETGIQGPVWAVCEGRDGSFFLGTERGVLRWREGGDHEWIDAMPDNRVRDVLAMDDGSVWIVCRTSVAIWRKGVVTVQADLSSLAGGREFWGVADVGGGEWVLFGTDVLLTGSPGRWTDLASGWPGGGGIHISATVAPDGSLWVATRNRGLACRKNGRWTTVDTGSGLSHEDVRDVRIDYEGNVWACTNGGGINLVKHRRFDVFGAAEGLGRHVTTALAVDRDGRLWAGTDGGGVKVFDGQVFQAALPQDAWKDPFVWSLLPRPNGEVWVGTFSSGILRMRNGSIEPMSAPAGVEDSWIPALMEDRKGNVWAGSHNGGVFRFDSAGVNRLKGAAAVEGAPVTVLLEDRAGVVWLATSGDGLWRHHSGAWEEIGRKAGLGASNVVALHEDDAGHLWVGTSGGGLALYLDGRFVSWDTRHGIAFDSVLQILDDGRGSLWLGTDVGLQRVAVDDLMAVARGERNRLQETDFFGRADGLPLPQFSSGHGNLAVKTRGGDLWFSLASGAVRVRAGGQERQAAPLKIHVESVSQAQSVVWKMDGATGRTRQVETDWPAEPLEFRFSAPSFTDPEKVRFRYRLSGLEKAWRDSDGRRSVTYQSLPPGDYRFEVMAARSGGAWTGTVASVGLTVRPRFWQTWWFRTAAGALGAAVFAAAVRWWSLRRLRRRMAILEQERKIEGERARIAQDLHDDLGATLTEINFLGVMGASGASSPVTRQRLEGIVERAQRMAKSLDEIVWTVNPTNDSLASTISYLCSRTQESLAAGGLRCRLDVEDRVPQAELDSEVRHHLLMAVNEAVNNVMKHAAAKELRLVIRHQNQRLRIAIEDDGCGFDPDAVPAGRNGLCNLRRRMESVGGSCRISSTVGQGTRVVLDLPLPGKCKRTNELSPRSGGFP